MITENDMTVIHDECVSVHGTAEEVLGWFDDQQMSSDGVFSFGKVMGAVGAQAVKRKELVIEDAIGAALVAGVEMGIRLERLRRERES